MTHIIDLLRSDYEATETKYMEVAQYLELCRDDPMAYATAQERMIKAIGEPEKLDTSADPRLSRIFLNRTVRTYPAFSDFYGMEETIERIVGFFKHGAQGLEERKQILYLLGPVGGGKSSLAERLKELMEACPIYVLCFEHPETAKTERMVELSPVFESPLALFAAPRYHKMIEQEYHIDARYLRLVLSPWAIKRLKQAGGDINRFKAARVMPSKLEQIAVMKTEPGDENNQDISSLVGKTDIRKLEFFSQNDPDAYSFSGALCRANQGLLEFVEIFKSPIKVLHPLLTATQEGNYMGTEAVSAIPFNGMVMAHCFSEDTELLTFDGWKSHDAIQTGDLLATMNIETSKLEYQPALRKFEQDYDGDMCHFQSYAADHLVTPNHGMVYCSQDNTAWRMRHAESLPNTGAWIPVSAENTLPDYDISDDALRLLVWVIADGHIQSDRTIAFHLKKDRKIQRVKELLTRMNIVFRESATETTRIKFDNNGFQKTIPDFYKHLSSRQCRIFLEEYAYTDGTRHDGNDDYYSLSTSVRSVADRIQHIAIASGSKCNMSIQDTGEWGLHYSLRIRVGVTKTSQDRAMTIAAYNGKVFCFETQNHTLVARRNGKVIITSNSNQAEWETFKNNKNNEAFIDRICVIKVPYCMRVTEEEKIYRKMIDASELKGASCAPSTLEMMAQFSVLTRLRAHENSTPWSKMSVYNGENIKETDPRAKSVQEYRDTAGVDEGMTGTSTRFSFKVISATFNHDPDEVSADPVHLMFTLELAIRREQLGKEIEDRYLDFIKSELAPRYAEFIGNEIQTAYLETYDDYGQTLFDRYISFADHWIDDIDYRDPDTGSMFDRDYLNSELEKIEKAAGIANPKDFRQEVVKFVLRQRARERAVKWTSYEKMKKVIERKMFSSIEALLPVISFSTKSTSEDAKKHADFVERMNAKGYTEKQVRRSVEWWMRVLKSN